MRTVRFNKVKDFIPPCPESGLYNKVPVFLFKVKQNIEGNLKSI